MKIKIDLTRKYVFALGFILFFINPSVALTADTITHVEDIEGTVWAQSTEGSNVGDEVTAELRSDEFSCRDVLLAISRAPFSVILSSHFIVRSP